jgi:hypothetical protein
LLVALLSRTTDLLFLLDMYVFAQALRVFIITGGMTSCTSKKGGA